MMERLDNILSHIDDITAVQIYSNIVYDTIHSCDIHWLKEFYQESPNWLMNWNICNKKKTLQWADMSDDEKKEYLLKDLDNYFS